MMKVIVLVVVMMMMMSRVEAFRSNRLMHSSSIRSSLKATESDAPEPDFEPENASLFNMNKRVRLGRSRDEDGKSNIWSIEPTMQVEEDDDEEGSGGNKNLFIGAAVIATAIAALPLFNAFSGLFPDPTDF